MNSILSNLKRPLYLGIVVGIIGFVLGLLWGWVIQPVKWVNADPSQLHQGYQDDFLRMTIETYGINGDKLKAFERYNSLGESAQTTLNSIKQTPGSLDVTLINQFSTLMASDTSLPTSQPEATSSGGSSLGQIGLIFLALVLIIIVIYAVYRFLKPTGGKTVTPAQQASQLSREVEMTDYSAMGEETPMAQYVTTYVIGDDLFDDSFSIDSASGEFLGECGVGISETIGVGDPKKVSAFEVWMFDKNDIQTVTKVLMSEHTFNDPSAFQRLQSKGEPIVVSQGLKMTLETATLQMIATVTDIEYGEGGLPENSFFNRVTLELAIWQKTSPIG
jgi:hypothetical protein